MAWRSATNVAWAERTNIVVSAPAGAAVGDFVVVGIFTGRATTALLPTAPDGTWTQITGSPIAMAAYSGLQLRLTVWVKRLDAAPPASWMFTHAAGHSSAMAAAFSGHVALGPVAVASGTGQSSSIAEVTTTQPDSEVLWLEWTWDGGAATPPSGMTERVENANSAFYLASQIYAAAGPTGTKSHTNGNGSGSGKPWGVALVTLQPTEDTPPPPYDGPEGWQDASAQAAAGTAQARILVVGDSIAEGEGAPSRAQRWLDQLIPALRIGLGIAGTGAGHTPPRYATYLGDSDSWRSPATASPAITAKTFTRNSGQYFQWTVTGTAVSVLYSGSVTVSIDGGGAETPPASSVITRWDKTGLSSGSHTVRVTGGTGGGQAVGVIGYSGDTPGAGLTYLDWAWTAASSDEFAGGAAYDVAQIGALLPHLVLDEQFGGNDALEGSSTPTQCADRFAARTAIYGGWDSQPTVVALIPPRWPAGSDVNEAAANGLGYVMDDYRDAVAARAVTLGCQVIDLRDSIGTMPSGWLASDDLHLNATGQTGLATAILAALSPAAETRTATGTLTLAGAATATATGGTLTRTATGALALAGSADGVAQGGTQTRTATGILTLDGTAEATASGGTVASTATGSLTLEGTGSAQAHGGTATRTAAGLLHLDGDGEATSSGGTISRAAEGVLTLDGTATTQTHGGTQTRTATGEITLTGGADASIVGGSIIRTAQGTLALAGHAPAATIEIRTSLGTITITGSADVAGGIIARTSTGHLVLEGAATAHPDGGTLARTATGSLALTGAADGQAVGGAISRTAQGMLLLSGQADGLTSGGTLTRAALGHLVLDGQALGLPSGGAIARTALGLLTLTGHGITTSGWRDITIRATEPTPRLKATEPTGVRIRAQEPT